MQKITTELKLTNGGILKFIVLKMLSGKTASLGEIHESLRRVGFRTPMGSLYPLVSAFRAKAYIASGFEESESGGALRTYALTEKGRQQLATLRSDWRRLSAIIAEIGKSY